jgi:hypothetical protein
MEKRVVLVSAAVAVLGVAAAVLGFVAEGTKSKASESFTLQSRLTISALLGVWTNCSFVPGPIVIDRSIRRMRRRS